LLPGGGVVESVVRVNDDEILLLVSLPVNRDDEVVFLGEVRRV
jgi:hypothetical protein